MVIASDQTLDPEIDRARSGALGVDDLVLVEVLFHPDLRRVGDRVSLGTAFSDAARGEVVLGRDTPSFRAGGWGEARPLGDPCVSRRQMVIRWDPARQLFDVKQEAEARRPVRLYGPDGALLGDAPLSVPPGSIAAIGDRVLLLLACRPADVVGPDLGMVGESQPMVALRAQIRALADTSDTVLVVGETGVGKELVAKAIHDASRRRKGPFIVVNCAALPESLIESELFGHAKGAFSGAQGPRDGLFRAASGGTIFLDEIGELPLAMQSKLLRVLQERAIRPVGESQERPVDVRVVAATNRDLAAEVDAGRFRQDLFARLEGPSVRVPALRERREDVPRLFVHFLRRRIDEEAAQAGQPSPSSWLVRDPGNQPAPLPMDFMLRLLGRPWVRNVRELEKLVAAVLVANRRPGEFVAPPLDASPSPRSEERASSNPPEPSSHRAGKPLGEAELIRELEAHDHVQHRVARALGISRTTLDKWLRDLGINRPKDLPREAIEEARAATGGDIEQMARVLKVSVRGLKLRMTELGIGEGRRPGA